jgi:hypothetical protein
LFYGVIYGKFWDYITVFPKKTVTVIRKSQPSANMHDIEDYVDFDSIVYYAVSKHEVDFDESCDGNKDNDNGTELLANMAGQKSSCGDVQVLASKQTPDKQKKR